jgi:hypothetical protein
MTDDDVQRGLQWFVFENTIIDLARQSGLSDAGLRWVRGELVDGGWMEWTLPVGPWRARRVELLEAVDQLLAGGDAVLLEHYRAVDGLAAPDYVGGSCND